MSEETESVVIEESVDDIILKTDGVTKRFGSLTAVDSVSIDIPKGKITSIIGPNGAGKTTLFNIFTGKYTPTEGKIKFQGESIAGIAPHRLVERGIVRSFQVPNFFMDLTTLENVRLATQMRYTGFKPNDFFRHHASLDASIEDAQDILDRVHLTDVAREPASNLSYGQRRHLEIGVALAADPDLLLMDEPTAGMSPEETRETVDLVEDIADEVTLTLIEHDMDIVMNVSDQIAVLNNGKLIARGTPSEIQRDDRVQKAYLGGGSRD